MGTEKILEYLQENGLTIKDLAIQCRLNPDSFSRALKHNKIGPRTADKLERYTYGKIPFSEVTLGKRPKNFLRRKKLRSVLSSSASLTKGDTK